MSEPESAWYFVGMDGSQQGPHSRASLLAMYSAGKLGATALVWSFGMDNWLPFSSAFKDYFPPPVPSAAAPPPLPVPAQPGKPTDAPAADDSRAFLGGSQHPWRRYFAKLIDSSTFGLGGVMVLIIAVAVLSPQQFEGLVQALDNPIIAGVLITVVWVPIEAFFLSVFGNTPARWLYGITVRSNSGGKLSFGKAFERTLLVAIQGMGVGIPIVALFTQIFAYRRLTKTGTTLWDNSVSSVVSHVQWGPFRAILCVLAALAVLFLLAVLNGLSPHHFQNGT